MIMTNSELDALDVRVANIMEYPVEYDFREPTSEFPYFVKKGDSRCLYYVTDDDANHLPWHPTRDARCREVVERWVVANGVRVEQTMWTMPGGVVNCHCVLREQAASFDTYVANAPTPGIALCLAVVEAFGGTVRGENALRGTTVVTEGDHK
jgi:hypothetical protein